MQTFNWNDANPDTVISEMKKGINRLGSLQQTYRDQFVQVLKDTPQFSTLFDKTHA